MQRYVSVVIFLGFFGTNSILGQVDILNDTWRDHLSYNNISQLAEAGDWIFAAAEKGLLSYNQKTYELRKHSKVTGLSDVNVSCIAYSAETGNLIVGYANGNIDLLREGESPVNLSDIKRRILTSSKRINKIYTHSTEAYLACGFGIVVLNLTNSEVKETYLLGENGGFLNITDITIYNNSIYATTDEGVFTASLNSLNLQDFSFWSRLTFIPQNNSKYKIAERFNKRLYLVYEDEATLEDRIITVNGTSFEPWQITNDTLITEITSANGYLGICSYRDVSFYNTNEQLQAQYQIVNNKYSIISALGIPFFASSYSGFLNWNETALRYLNINSPNYNTVSNVFTAESQVWVTSGGSGNRFTQGMSYLFSDNEWTNYSGNQIWTEDLQNTNSNKVAIDPLNPHHVYISSYASGITEINNGTINHIIHPGLPEFSDIPNGVGLRVSGLDFDSQNNLWFILDIVSNPLCRLDADGNLTRYEISNSTLISNRSKYSDLLITNNNHIWISTNEQGVIVLEEQADGEFEIKQFMIKNQSGTVLNKTYCLEQDLDDNIWIGTNLGPIIYYDPVTVFNQENITGIQPTYARNDGTDNIDYLLFNEVIYDIKCDGGNQKWIATENSGAYLVSDDGKKTLLNFHPDNSPVLSKTVTGIGIQEKTGEVFFATSEGLLSYGGSASRGFDNYDNAYVYPNPVRPDYEGIITVTGLVEKTVVKITDISGNLVWETNSLGGKAHWDGRNFNGQRVSSGIYLFLLATEDGSQSHVVKLLFMH